MAYTLLNGSDRVIDHGTSGMWTWRKWASGVLECWGTYTASIAVDISSPAYGGYRSDNITVTNYPIQFKNTPQVLLMGGAGCNGCWVNNASGGGVAACKFYLSSAVSMATSNKSIHVHAIGAWK